MVYRSSRPREAKRIQVSAISTLDDKFRRHKNKKRIWLRAVKRLALQPALVPIHVNN